MHTYVLALLPLLLLAPTTLEAAPSAVPAQRGNPLDGIAAELSPFTGVRTNGDAYEVRVEGTWYRLVSIDGTAAADFRVFCDRTYGGRSEKRFAEDLVAVMIGMGIAPQREVDLELAELDGGAIVERTVEMTEANRRAVWQQRNGDARLQVLPFDVRRHERAHATEVDPAYADLARGTGADLPGPRIPRERALQDLDQLEWHVRHEHSYATLTGIDLAAAFDAVRAGLPEELPVADLTERVARLVARLGDGHGRVRGLDRALPSGFLPCLLAEAEGGVVAFHADRRDFVDAERPFVRAIDGRPVEDWLAAVEDLVPVGSAANTRFRALRRLRHLAYARQRLGMEPRGAVKLELVDAEGRNARTWELELTRRKPIYGPWPRSASRRLGDVGYVRIPSMDDEPRFLRELRETMSAFADVERLVIDVRGNGGGTRDALRVVLPHVLVREHGPLVHNIAAYRLPDDEAEDETEGHLANRGLFPAGSTRWTERERHAIGLAAMPFIADWEVPGDAFTDWHYGVVSPTADSPTEARDVVVLMDTGCFSATDVFLAALWGLPGVTLMGTPSGGGSGRSRSHRLAWSGIEIRLSTMASFRPGGRRFDGLGIEPDVRVLPRPEDFLEGRGDSALERALSR